MRAAAYFAASRLAFIPANFFSGAARWHSS
jgi:hypothetical protein